MSIWSAPSDMDYYDQQDRWDVDHDELWERMVCITRQEAARLEAERATEQSDDEETEPPF